MTRNVDTVIPEPDFVISATATDPVQLTITKTSIKIIKDLAEVKCGLSIYLSIYLFIYLSIYQSFTKEYGKKVEGRVNIKSLTGAPFTVVNKVSHCCRS